MGDPRIAETFKRLIEVHDKKNSDYSGDGKGHYHNFEIAATVMSWFDKPEDKVFACLIGVKLGRLVSLLNSGKSAQNESVDDTFDDQTLYTQLWKSGRADVAKYLQRGLATGAFVIQGVSAICKCKHPNWQHRQVTDGTGQIIKLGSCTVLGCECGCYDENYVTKATSIVEQPGSHATFDGILLPRPDPLCWDDKCRHAQSRHQIGQFTSCIEKGCACRKFKTNPSLRPANEQV